MPSTGSAALGSAPKGVERAEQDVGLGHGGKGGQVGQQVLSYGSARSPSPDEDDMRSLRKWVLHPERPDVELRKDLVRAEERHGRITAMLLAYLHTLQDVSSQNESDAWPPSGDTLGLCVPAFNQVEGFDSIEPVDPNDNPFLRRLFRGDLQPGSLAASFWHWVEAHAPPSPSTVSRFAECINRLSDSAGRAILRAAAFEAILRLIPARHEQDRSTRLWILYALGAEDKVYDYVSYRPPGLLLRVLESDAVLLAQYCGLGPLVSSENCQFPRKRAHDADSPHAITANRYSLFVSAWEAAANPHENLPGSFLDAYARFALDDAVARAGDRTMDVHVSEQPLPAGVREGVLRAYPAPDQAARRPFYYLGAYLADKLKAPWDTMSVLFTKARPNAYSILDALTSHCVPQAKKTTAKVGGTDWDRYVGFVNIKNCHWVAIVIDAGKRTYSVYDPLGISNPDVLKMLRTMTNGLTQDGIVPSDGRQWQVNSIQLAFFEMLLKPPGTKAWPAEYMPALRRKYLVDLACGKVLNVPGIDLRVMAEGIAREAKWERMDG
ncbi:hypothetical protein Rhopal_003326-T1 [Rhodotorula paludigena]|uniref:Ubiquitin-like protease family profile domain-containing protein n=1 Tax=Rhodotorula paludigena TaxID=86838 RepID=A0AAV5GLF7_9BASI|nr:hypothetical protein Rhopal_003326-T1 [Rhodotorula paludigena]